MSRGFVEIVVYQQMVLEKMSDEDKPLAKEIFDLTAEKGVTVAYPFLHGFGIGFPSWLVITHLIFGARAFEKSPLLVDLTLIVICLAIPAWLLYKFRYGPKYQRLCAEFQARLNNDQNFKRVHELIRSIGKEIQAENRF